MSYFLDQIFYVDTEIFEF